MKRLWITWEKQRRSYELADIFGCKLVVLNYSGILRYLVNITVTAFTFQKEKPQIVFAQNPSMVLACTACLLKSLFKFKLVIDRHSNFLLTPKKRNSLHIYIFHYLSFFTIRNADLTIITNEELSHAITVYGGYPYILPDKIPLLTPLGLRRFHGKANKVLFISSFAEDEPLEELFEAVRNIQMAELSIFISGNSSKMNKKLQENIPENVILTGFLSNEDFIDLLFQVDAVIVLTKMEYTLLCGCYEALAAEKPLITSDTGVLKNLFENAVFVRNESDSIKKGILDVLNDLGRHRENSIRMKNKLNRAWKEKFDELQQILTYNL